MWLWWPWWYWFLHLPKLSDEGGQMAIVCFGLVLYKTFRFLCLARSVRKLMVNFSFQTLIVAVVCQLVFSVRHCWKLYCYCCCFSSRAPNFGPKYGFHNEKSEFYYSYLFFTIKSRNIMLLLCEEHCWELFTLMICLISRSSNAKWIFMLFTLESI